MKYLPTLRGFVAGVALWTAVVSAGCGFSVSKLFPPDPPKERLTAAEIAAKGLPGLTIDPETGNEVPNVAASFIEGKAAAKADFNKSVKVLTWWACAACIAGGIFMLVASFFLPWASTKLAAYCLAGAGLTLITRYVLLTYGTLTADIAFWIMVATAIGAAGLVGLPALIAYVRRIDWKKGQHLAAQDHTEAATALLVTADPTLMPIRKQVEQWLIDLKGNIPEAATEARMQLVKLGVLKPGDK